MMRSYTYCDVYVTPRPLHTKTRNIRVGGVGLISHRICLDYYYYYYYYYYYDYYY